MSRYNTTITDKDGSKKSGYIVDGTSFYSDGTRISEGSSVVDAYGKTWTRPETVKESVSQKQLVGMVPVIDLDGKESIISGRDVGSWRAGQDALSREKELAAEMQRRQAEAAAREQEAIRLATERSVSSLEAERNRMSGSFDDAARQAYIRRMQNQRDLPAMLAAQGQSGGASETANYRVLSDYDESLNDIFGKRTEAFDNIGRAIADVRTTGDINTANLQATNIRNDANNYFQLMQQKLAEEKATASANQDLFKSTIGAYSNDYMAEINRIMARVQSGDNSEAWKIPYLQAARNAKIMQLQKDEEAAKQQALENAWKQQQINYQTGKPYYNPRSGGTSGVGSLGGLASILGYE